MLQTPWCSWPPGFWGWGSGPSSSCPQWPALLSYCADGEQQLLAVSLHQVRYAEGIRPPGRRVTWLPEVCMEVCVRSPSAHTSTSCCHTVRYRVCTELKASAVKCCYDKYQVTMQHILLKVESLSHTWTIYICTYTYNFENYRSANMIRRCGKSPLTTCVTPPVKNEESI